MWPFTSLFWIILRKVTSRLGEVLPYERNKNYSGCGGGGGINIQGEKSIVRW